MYKVLIVEDESIIRKGLIFSFDFKSLDCMVVDEAENGIEGISKIRELSPDIVITDINMPLKNGLDMIYETKDEYKYSAIILTSFNEFEYAKKAIEYDVKQYILKPIDYDELRKAIKKCIKDLEMRKSFEVVNKNSKEINDKVLISENKNNSYYVSSMIKIIEEKFNDKLTMQDCVEKLGVSATLLNNRFKEETGLTFNDYLNRYRIQVAIDMLKEKKMPIYMIASETGFSDYKYFVKVFYKYVGCSPKNYTKIVEF